MQNILKKFMILFCICSIPLFNNLYSSEITDGYYLTVKDGHFYYKNERIRLWGVNILGHHVRNFKGAEVTAKRLKDMGFNAVHIWIPKGWFHSGSKKWNEFAEVKKGSESGLDLLDYFVYCCKKEGIFVSFCLSVRGDTITPDVYDLVKRDDIDKEQWFHLVKNFSKHLKFVDPSIKQAYIEKMKFFLNRVNPYTGKRYAEEEAVAFYQLEDEMGFLAWPPGRIDSKENLFHILVKPKWEKFLKEKYKTSEAMWKAWGQQLKYKDGDTIISEDINDMKAIFYEGKGYSVSYPEGKESIFYAGHAVQSTPAKRAEDAWEFLYGLANEFYEDYLTEFRKQATEGKGAAVVPIAVDSIIYSRAGYFYHTQKHSDFVCGTGIPGGSGITKKGDAYGWNISLQPPLAQHYSVDFSLLKVAGKPHCPVAGGHSLNNPFRAMVPFIAALWASWQDWDGVFTYWWGWFPNDLEIEPENYSRFPLRVDYPGGKKRCYDHLNDEVSLAVHRISSQVFRKFLLDSAVSPTRFKFGRNLLYSSDAANYYHHLWPFMAKTSYKFGTEILFDEKGDYKIQWEGNIMEKDISNPLVWENGVEWNWEKEYIKIDSKYVKGYAGMHEGTIQFSDGIRVEGINRKFIVFLLVSPEKKPIKDAEMLYYTIVSTSRNAGYREDFSKLEFGQHGIPLAWSVVTEPGGLPIMVERVDCQMVLPFRGTVENYDFSMKLIDRTGFDKMIKISGEKPIFTGIITKE